MALSDYFLTYTKDWTNPEDFPTYENREDQVRADIQLLFNEMRAAFNAFLTDLAAGLIPFSPTDGVPETNVQAAIQDVQEQAASAAAGSIPQRSLDGSKLKLKAVSQAEIDDEAVGADQLADGGVTNAKLAANSVRAEHVKDGELTLDKFVPGALDGKADLVNGILKREQRRWRVEHRVSAYQTYTLILEDAETALLFTNAEALAVQIPTNSDVGIQTGAAILLVCSGVGGVTVTPATGVTLTFPGGTGDYAVSKTGAVILLIKTSSNNWAAVAFPGLLAAGEVKTAAIADAAVTEPKLADANVTTQKLADAAVTEPKIANAAVTAAKIAAGAVSISLSGTIETTDWTGAAAPYAAEIAASGLLATDKPVVDAVMSGAYATDESLDEAWGLIYRAVAGADTITFYAREVPAVDLPFSLFAVRK